MESPNTPENEQARLQNLKSLNILDTPAEERFDHLTRIASKVFDVPIALVSLVDDDRQWFKSAVGLSAKETSREISFCGHSILGQDIFIVNNTKLDQRFSDNPLVINEPNIAFYAGCPLTSSDGYQLGTLCIIDRIPRVLAEDEKMLLADLAAMVEREIELTQLALIDELTHIPNRRGFMTFAEKNLELCKRNKLPASIVCIDINGFKQINDSYGHAEGDRALFIIARSLEFISRKSDIIARMGGDEFVMMLPNTPEEAATEALKRLKDKIAKLSNEDKIPYEIQVSIGISEYNPILHASVYDIVRDADKNMYKHKLSTKTHLHNQVY